MNLWLLAQEVAHIKRSTKKSILGLNGLNNYTLFDSSFFYKINTLNLS